MTQWPLPLKSVRILAILAIGSAVSVCAVSRVEAADPLGLYVGGAIGQSRVEATAPQYWAGSFEEDHAAFKVMGGVHPIPLVSAEAEYIDFGNPAGTVDLRPADVRLTGAAAFGVLHLSAPFVEGFAKAGIARLDSTTRGATDLQPACASCQLNMFELKRTYTSFATGGGLQSTWGSWSARLEYEVFQAAGGHPRLLSAGVIWALF
jgi:hypothetical protein